MKPSVKKPVKEPATNAVSSKDAPVDLRASTCTYPDDLPQDPACDAEEDFSLEEVGHLDALSRRAQWLEQRMATMDPCRGGARYDVQEYLALMWVFNEFGAVYTPSRYCSAVGGEAPAGEEEPPIRDPRSFPKPVPPPRVQSEVWQPGRRPAARMFPIAPFVGPNGSFTHRFFPGGQV